jgi:hypothetical protein
MTLPTEKVLRRSSILKLIMQEFLASSIGGGELPP